MSTAIELHPTMEAAQLRREVYASEEATHRLRVFKIFCALAIGICFWFSVPYYLPLKLDPDPMKAAANEAAAYEGNLSRQIAMPVILLLSGYMLYRLPKRGRFTKSSKLMMAGLAYVGLAIASTCWSVDPAITRKRIVVFLIDLTFAYTIARVASMLELALLGFTCTGAVALISLGVDIFVQHTFAPGDPDYRFMGVMTANFQAMNLLVCILCGLTLAQRRPRWLVWMAPTLGVFAALLLLTRARIGTFICVGMTLAMLLRMAKELLQAQARALVIMATLLVLVPTTIYAVGRSGGDAITDVFMMGRKDTQNTANLSNRAPLWGELMDSVSERPTLGFGFEAFWSPERVQKVSFDQGWMVPHAHNTYLDQMLSLGIIGSFLYASTLIGGCVVGWRRYRRNRSESNLLPALLLTWIALLSMTESTPVSPYLPTLIVYSCLVKLCMQEGSEAEADLSLAPGTILGRPTPKRRAETRARNKFSRRSRLMPQRGAEGLVSIIIPTYRRAVEVRAAAESALAQTWRQVEVLVISDGPDPETRASVEGMDERLRYLEMPVNGGPAAARNAGVAASHGEWLTFLDDDDAMLPGKVEAEMALADPNEPTRMVSCRTFYRHGNRDDIWPKRPIAPGEDVAEYILLRPSLLGRPGVIPIQTLLVHRSIVERIPFSTHKDHEDWAWLLDVWHLAGARVVFAWEPLVIYNIVTESVSRSRRMNWTDSLAWAQRYRKWIGDRAFCSFLCTKAALKAKRAGDWKGLRQIAGLVLRSNPGFLNLVFLSAITMLPSGLLQSAWKRSLHSTEQSPKGEHLKKPATV